MELPTNLSISAIINTKYVRQVWAGKNQTCLFHLTYQLCSYVSMEIFDWGGLTKKFRRGMWVGIKIFEFPKKIRSGMWSGIFIFRVGKWVGTQILIRIPDQGITFINHRGWPPLRRGKFTPLPPLMGTYGWGLGLGLNFPYSSYFYHLLAILGRFFGL